MQRCTLLKSHCKHHYFGENPAKMKARFFPVHKENGTEMAVFFVFSWRLQWQDSQKCWHFGHHFTNLVRERCPLQTSTHRFRSTFQLSKYGSIIEKQRPAAFGNRFRGFPIAPRHKCATLHKTDWCQGDGLFCSTYAHSQLTLQRNKCMNYKHAFIIFSLYDS